MSRQECIEIMDIALKYLCWQGGTIWEVERELYKQTGIVRTTKTIHEYIRDMLVQLGAMK